MQVFGAGRQPVKLAAVSTVARPAWLICSREGPHRVVACMCCALLTLPTLCGWCWWEAAADGRATMVVWHLTWWVSGWVGGCWLAGVISVFGTPRCVAPCEGWGHVFRGSSPTGLKVGREDRSQLHQGVSMLLLCVGLAPELLRAHSGQCCWLSARCLGLDTIKWSSTAAICMRDCLPCIVDGAWSKSADRLYDCWADVVACGCQSTCTCV